MPILWPTLTVRDVDASLSFYSRHLGLPRDFAEQDGAGQTFLGSVEVGETVIMFEREARNATLESNHGERSGVTLTICLMTTDDIDRLYQRLRQDGVKVCSPIGDRPWGNRDFTIQDPDGYRIIVAKPMVATLDSHRPNA